MSTQPKPSEKRFGVAGSLTVRLLRQREDDRQPLHLAAAERPRRLAHQRSDEWLNHAQRERFVASCQTLNHFRNGLLRASRLQDGFPRVLSLMRDTQMRQASAALDQPQQERGLAGAVLPEQQNDLTLTN